MTSGVFVLHGPTMARSMLKLLIITEETLWPAHLFIPAKSWPMSLRNCKYQRLNWRERFRWQGIGGHFLKSGFIFHEEVCVGTKKRQDKKISQWTLCPCERQELFVFIREIRG